MKCLPHFRRQIRRAHLPSVSYSPAQVAKMYNFPTDFDGSGVTVGIIELGGGIAPETGLVVVLVAGGKNAPDGPNGADGEVCLDNQIIREMAPGAKRRIYFAPNTTAGFAAAIRQAVDDGCSVISISWGGPEDQWSADDIKLMETALSYAVAMGVSVFAAAGDNGSGDGEPGQHVDYPASSPNVTGVGGTALTTISETVWNDGTDGGATGGGISTVFARPGWQTIGNQAPGVNRAVPDVAFNGDPNTGYKIAVDGTQQVIGGTSAGAPGWAALAAILCQALGRKLGLLNKLLYPLADTFALRDITSGNNGVFMSQPGYDCCTGLGSPDGAKLLAALMAGGTPVPPLPPPPVPVPPPPPVPLPTSFTLDFTQGIHKGWRYTFRAPVSGPAGKYVVHKLSEGSEAALARHLINLPSALCGKDVPSTPKLTLSGIVAFLENLVHQFGPAILPTLEAWVATLSIPDWEKAVVDQVLEGLVGGK